MRSTTVRLAGIATIAALGVLPLPGGAHAAKVLGLGGRAAAASFVGPSRGALAGISVATGRFGPGHAPAVVIGAPRAAPAGRAQAGAVYVEFGPFGRSQRRLGQDPRHELVIEGAAAGDNAGIAVAGAGDVSGSGQDALVIGAYNASNNGLLASGSAYVVFPRGPGVLDLGRLGGAGYRVDGAAAGDRLGRSVAGAGDIDGDGRPDIAVGAPGADPLGRDNAGAAYVLFGAPRGGRVSASGLGRLGLEIDGAAAGDWTGWSLAGAGDVNGDRVGDLVIGAPAANSDHGAAWFVFGARRAAGQLDLAAPAGRALHVFGGRDAGLLGWSVAGVGDLRGNGLADVAVGGWATARHGRQYAGAVTVVGARRAARGHAIRLTSTRIIGGRPGDEVGRAVAAIPAGAGRRPTLLVGASTLRGVGGDSVGGVYAIPGQRALAPGDLRAPPLGTVLLRSSDAHGRLGDALAVGSGLLGGTAPDVVIGAPEAGGDQAGITYVVPAPAAGAAGARAAARSTRTPSPAPG